MSDYCVDAVVMNYMGNQSIGGEGTYCPETQCMPISLKYSAPELGLHSTGKRRPQADVFSLGMIVSELLLLTKDETLTVFEPARPQRRQLLKTSGAFRMVAESGITKVLAKATHRNPSTRHRTLEELWSDLEKSLPDRLTILPVE